MANEKIKLRCKANAHVDGDTVKAGKVDSYDADTAKRLLGSGRFEKVSSDEKPAAKKAD